MLLETANSGTMVFAMLFEPANSGTMVFAMVLETANSGTMVFAMLLETANSGTMVFGMLLEAANSGTMVFAMRLEPANSGTMVFAMVLETANSGTVVFAMRCFQTPRASAAYYVCTQKVDFPATEAPRARGVLRLYYKSRLSSHGSSGCPRRTIRLCYKSRLSSHGSSACPRRTTFVLQKVDFPATEAPCVRGVLRLYYKSRFSSHGSPRRTTSVLHKSTKKTQKNYGFRTASTRKPAEGLRLHVKKRKNTTVLAPLQRRNPQRGYVCMSQNAKTRLFWHRANAETRRGLSAATQKSTKNDGFSTATRRLPAEGCPRT